MNQIGNTENVTAYFDLLSNYTTEKNNSNNVIKSSGIEKKRALQQCQQCWQMV